MKIRDIQGRFLRARHSRVWQELKRVRQWPRIAGAIIVLVAIPGAIICDAVAQELRKPVIFEVAHAAEVRKEEERPWKVLIDVHIDWTEERIIKEIRDTFPENPDVMVKVARCESALKATAKGPTNDHGIFQIHMPSWRAHLSDVDLSDPAENIAFARWLYDHGGLAHWRASKPCWTK